MSDLADFLRARYAERGAIAEAATRGPWEGVVDRHQRGQVDASVWADSIGYYVTEKVTSGERQKADAHHIAANDPATVIADLDAKLAIVDELDPGEVLRGTDAELHARCAHPAWEYRTTEGPRKQWDGIDDPPCDDDGNPEVGWERNIDAGIPGEGWERFDYIEESYWRRLRPGGPRKPFTPIVLRILARPFAGHPDYQEEWAA
ncbi:DUF6221 family protein [Streptomyces sp. NPDC002913]